MPKNAAAAQKAKEKKEKKALELQIKTSKEKCDEGRSFLETEGKVQPQYNKAIACFDTAIELYAENADAFTFRGNAYLEQKLPEQAMEDYTKALSLNPQSVMSLEGRASCHEALQQWDKAIGDYSAITSIQPENDHAFNMRGCCRLRKRPVGLKLKRAEFEAVVEDFMTALRLNENNYHAHANLGKANEEHGHYLKAIDEYSRALAVQDDYQYAIFRRGCASMNYVDEQRKVQREDPSELSVEEQIKAEEQRDKRASSEKELLKQAIADFTRIIGEEKEKELTALVYRGTCHQLLGEVNKAEEDWNFAKKAAQSAEVPPPKGFLDVLEIKLDAVKKKD